MKNFNDFLINSLFTVNEIEALEEFFDNAIVEFNHEIEINPFATLETDDLVSEVKKILLNKGVKISDKELKELLPKIETFFI